MYSHVDRKNFPLRLWRQNQKRVIIKKKDFPQTAA
jgi:hypothetical protein